MIVLSIQSFMGTWANWIPLSVMAVIAAVLFHGILLMAGRAFSIRELESYAYSEILQAGATLFMVVFLVVMVGSAINLARGYIHGDLAVGGDAPCARTFHIGSTGATVTSTTEGDKLDPGSTMDEAYDAIRCRIQTRAKAVADIQDSLANDKAGTWWEFNALNMAASLFGITVFKGDWIGSLYKQVETKRITNNLCTAMIISLNAQSAVLEYLQGNMLHIFLPFGLLLRCFYFTRGPGALMMALGIGFYFIFPVFFVLLDPGFTASPPPTPTPGAGAGLQPYCYATMANTVSMLTSMQSAGGLGSTADLSAALDAKDLSKSYVSLILHPLVALFLTLVFVRYIMTILGGEPYELMKMVGKVV